MMPALMMWIELMTYAQRGMNPAQELQEAVPPGWGEPGLGWVGKWQVRNEKFEWPS